MRQKKQTLISIGLIDNNSDKKSMGAGSLILEKHPLLLFWGIAPSEFVERVIYCV
jgi:hypothetical protein